MRKFKEYLLSFKNNYLDERLKHHKHFDHASVNGHASYAEQGRKLLNKVDSLVARLDKDVDLHEAPTPAMHQAFKQAENHAKKLSEMVKNQKK